MILKIKRVKNGKVAQTLKKSVEKTLKRYFINGKDFKIWKNKLKKKES